MARPTRRTTLQAYRVTVTGARPDPTGRRLVAELAGTPAGDFLRLREAGRRTWVTLDLAELYRRALLAATRKQNK